MIPIIISVLGLRDAFHAKFMTRHHAHAYLQLCIGRHATERMIYRLSIFKARFASSPQTHQARNINGEAGSPLTHSHSHFDAVYILHHEDDQPFVHRVVRSRISPRRTPIYRRFRRPNRHNRPHPPRRQLHLPGTCPLLQQGCRLVEQGGRKGAERTRGGDRRRTYSNRC